MCPKKKRKQFITMRGVTLIELLVAVALVSILFFGLASIYILMDDAWDRGASLVNLQRNGSYAMYEFSTTIRQGSMAVVTPTQLTVQDGSGTTIGRFYLQGSDNSLRDDSGTKIIPSTVDSLAFSQAGATIHVDLLLVDDRDNAAFFNTNVSMRN
jgi:prepilin-type N-terminal cleavage/methylation domain-containing protein